MSIDDRCWHYLKHLSFSPIKVIDFFFLNRITFVAEFQKLLITAQKPVIRLLLVLESQR